MLYVSTSIWVLRTQNAGRNSHFQWFILQKSLEKCKKVKKLQQKITISTSIWRAQYPSAGQNIQHLYLLKQEMI